MSGGGAAEVSIFRVPESLRQLRPLAYSPWLIGLGPLHHFHPRLYQVEPFKIAVAKRGLQRFNIPDFGALVRQLDPLLPRVRACYFPGDLRLLSPALGWAMAIDGLFFLELLCDLEGITSSRLHSFEALPFHDGLTRPLSSVTAICDAAHWKPPVHSMLINDAVLLENQIPISILAEAVGYFSPDLVNQVLTRDLDSLCGSLCPLPGYRQDSNLPNDNSSPTIDQQLISPPAHLLDYLYSNIIGGGGASGRSYAALILDPIDDMDIHAEISQHVLAHDWTPIGPADRHHDAVFHPFTFMGSIFRGAEIEAGSHASLEATVAAISQQVPTATELHHYGKLKFQSKKGDLRIDFDERKKTIAVPIFKWNPYCEVVLRNLAVYEAMAQPSKPSPHDLPLTQYIHFMHMIICSGSDVELLMDSGVIVDSPREESYRIRVMFCSLCTCRMNESKLLGGGKLLDHKLRRRLNRCKHAYADVRSHYNKRTDSAVTKYLTLFFFAFFLGFSYCAGAVGVLSLVCGFIKKLSAGTGGDCSSCVANVAAFISSGSKQLDAAV